MPKMFREKAKGTSSGQRTNNLLILFLWYLKAFTNKNNCLHICVCKVSLLLCTLPVLISSPKPTDVRADEPE